MIPLGPNPFDYYDSAIVSNIVIIDEMLTDDPCWQWVGKIRQPSGSPWYRGKRVISYAEGLPREVAATCRNPLCVNPEHWVHVYSEAGRMCFVDDNTIRRENGCLDWTAELRDGNVPTFRAFIQGVEHRNMSVRQFNYCVEYIAPGLPWPTAGAWTAKCGNRVCVEPSHVDAPSIRPVIKASHGNLLTHNFRRR